MQLQFLFIYLFLPLLEFALSAEEERLMTLKRYFLIATQL